MNNYRKPTPNSQSYFSKTADKTHKINLMSNTVMRGGTRL